MPKRRAHGTGHVYQPTYTTADGHVRHQKVWWLAFWWRGKLVRESAGTESKAEAERKLRARMVAKDVGLYAGPEARKTTISDLADILADNYATNGRDAREALRRFDHLTEHFGKAKLARDVTPDRIVKYQAARLKDGARPATVNRELAALRRAFRLALKAGRVERKPEFELLREDNIRTGFFERDQFEAVRARLPEWLRPVVTLMYLTGWRTSEALRLEWSRVDLKAGIIRLDPGTTKNREGRTLPYRALPELAEMIKTQRAGTRQLEQEKGCIIPWVFHRDGRGLLLKGGPDKAVYVEWRAACEAAGLPGRLLHDFRRSAVRNLERAGVSRSVAMKITGHKTESVYKRYAIVSEADLAEGLAKVAGQQRRAK